MLVSHLLSFHYNIQSLFYICENMGLAEDKDVPTWNENKQPQP